MKVQFSDIKVLVNNETFECNKYILNQIPFISKFIDPKSSWYTPGDLEIDMQIDNWNLLYNYLYSNDKNIYIKSLSVDNKLELAHAFDYLCMEDDLYILERYIDVTKDNVLDYIRICRDEVSLCHCISKLGYTFEEMLNIPELKQYFQLCLKRHTFLSINDVTQENITKTITNLQDRGCVLENLLEMMYGFLHDIERKSTCIKIVLRDTNKLPYRLFESIVIDNKEILCDIRPISFFVHKRYDLIQYYIDNTKEIPFYQISDAQQWIFRKYRSLKVEDLIGLSKFISKFSNPSHLGLNIAYSLIQLNHKNQSDIDFCLNFCSTEELEKLYTALE